MILMQPIHFQKCTRGHAIRTICKQYSRGPASQVGYQRERDVTGEFPFRRFEPCIGPLLFFLLQISINYSHSTTQAWLGALV